MAPANLVFLIASLVFALLLGGVTANVLLLFAAAAELLFLGTVPRNERFRRAVRARKIDERRKEPRDRDVFRTLAKEDQKRYVRFRNMEKAIKDNYAKLPYSSQGLLDSHLKKLDGLLDAHLNLLQLKERYVRFRNIEKAIRDNFSRLSYASQGLLDAHLKKIDSLLDSYLNLLQSKDRYERFAQRTGEEEIVRAMDALRAEMAHDPPRVRAIKERRLQILEKRLDKFKKANENLDIIEAQLATIEDVTRYVYEQSLTMQNPEEVSFQLDTLVSEVEETQASVEAIGEAFGDPMASLTEIDLAEFETTLGEQAAEPRPRWWRAGPR